MFLKEVESMPYRSVFLFFILGLAIPCTFSQQAESQSETQKKAYTFINRPYPDSLEYNTSMIIQEIALANNQRKSDVTFSLNYELNYKIEANQLFIRIRMLSLAGNTRYMKFGIGEQLYPSHARLRLSLKKDRYVSKRFELPAIDLESGPDWIHVPIEKALLNDAELVFSDISFYFDEEAVNNIFSYFEMIDDYYGSALVCDSLIKLSFSYELENELYLPENLDFLLFLTKTQKKLNNKKFLNQLPLKLYDPAAYLAKLELLERRLNRTQTLCMQLLASNQQPELSADLLFKELLSLTRRLISWSGKTDHYFQQSFYELAMINYLPPDFSLHEELTPYSRNEISCIFIEKQLAMADTYIAERDYATAYDLLKSLLQLSSETMHCDYTTDITAKQSTTASKIYDSYLRVSEKAIETNNFEFGIEYLGKAKNFLEKNVELVRNGSRLKHIQQMLAEKYYDELNITLQQHDYEKALSKLNELKTFLRKNEDLQLAEFDYRESLETIREGLSQEYLAKASHLFNRNEYEQAQEYLRKAENVKETEVFDQKIYTDKNHNDTKDSYTIRESLISKGLQALKAKQVQEAHNLFLQARKESGQDHLKSRLDSLIRITSGKLIDQSIINFRVALFQARIEKAKAILDEIEEYSKQSGHGLSLAEIEELRKELSESNCEAYWKRYERNTLQGFKAIDSSDFTLAVSFFETAIEIMPQLDDCGFSDSIALKAKIKYRPAAAYQEKYGRLKNKLFQSGFTSAIEDYISLDSMYLEQGLEEFHVERYRISDFLRQQENPLLYFQTIEYLNDQKNCAAALNIFSELISSDYPCRKTRDIQKEMAEVCYRKDKSKGKDFLPDEDLVHHTRTRACMHYFEKRYNYLVNRDDIMSIFKKDEPME